MLPRNGSIEDSRVSGRPGGASPLPALPSHPPIDVIIERHYRISLVDGRLARISSLPQRGNGGESASAPEGFDSGLRAGYLSSTIYGPWGKLAPVSARTGFIRHGKAS
jgi:hypothetical protein